MNRRRTLVTLGAIAFGGGTLVGSGAFSQVGADRSVNVALEGDDAAFLRLAAVSENSGFVNSSGGTLELNLDGSGSAGGSGLNYDAVTYVEPLFEIKNDGNEAVGIRIGSNASTDGNVSVGDYTVDGSTVRAFQYSNTETINVAFYACDTGTLSGDNDFSDSALETLTGTNNGSIVQDSFGNASNLDLTVGASVEVAFAIDATGADNSTIAEGTDLLNEVEVVASAEQA